MVDKVERKKSLTTRESFTAGTAQLADGEVTSKLHFHQVEILKKNCINLNMRQNE